jgi:hypothetical protein
MSPAGFGFWVVGGARAVSMQYNWRLVFSKGGLRLMRNVVYNQDSEETP